MLRSFWISKLVGKRAEEMILHCSNKDCHLAVIIVRGPFIDNVLFFDELTNVLPNIKI